MSQHKNNRGTRMNAIDSIIARNTVRKTNSYAALDIEILNAQEVERQRARESCRNLWNGKDPVVTTYEDCGSNLYNFLKTIADKDGDDIFWHMSLAPLPPGTILTKGYDAASNTDKVGAWVDTHPMINCVLGKILHKCRLSEDAKYVQTEFGYCVYEGTVIVEEVFDLEGFEPAWLYSVYNNVQQGKEYDTYEYRYQERTYVRNKQNTAALNKLRSS